VVVYAITYCSPHLRNIRYILPILPYDASPTYGYGKWGRRTMPCHPASLSCLGQGPGTFFFFLFVASRFLFSHVAAGGCGMRICDQIGRGGTGWWCRSWCRTHSTNTKYRRVCVRHPQRANLLPN